ncbi:MAG: diguanylate cyclase [Acidobacteria bacterium]|nr:diguanylate cyclase [Acidobacteriota bacterium]
MSGQYRFDLWNTDNGLPQNGVRQITQTPDGYLWFTTFDGLVRFDGVRFSAFNKSNTKGIINNRFTGIFSDVDGTVYGTTMEDGVLTVYRNGVFSSMTSDQIPGHYIDRIERKEDGILKFLVEDEDRTTKSWYSLQDGKFEFMETRPGFGEDFEIKGRDGTKWIVGAEGVTEYRGGQVFKTAIDLSKLTYRVNTFVDREGSLWLGENSVHRIRGGMLKTFSEREGLPRNSLYHSFWQEDDGSVWFSSGGAASRSIGLVQAKGDDLVLWGAEQGLTAGSIQSVFNDREGNSWLATDRGLYRRRKQVIKTFSTADGIDHPEVYPLYRDRKGDVWIGTSRGLSIYSNGKFRPLELTSPAGTAPADKWRPERMSVQSLWEDPSGNMWVGLNGGIYLVRDRKAEILFRGSHVFAIRGDRAGNVWAATNKGLLRFNDYTVTAQFSAKDGLPNEFMTLIFEDSKGTLWFGGYGGLSKFENGRFTNYTKNEGLAGNYVRTIYEDGDGTLWIGTYDEGMSRFKDGRFVNYTEANGLYNSGVFAIEEDQAGYFWISSNRGIYRVKRQELNDLADGKISKINSVGYGKGDGMLSNECNGGRQPASLRTEDGKFWFPTQDGIAVVDPSAEKPNPLPPTVVIEEVLVEREPVHFQGGLEVPPGKRDVEIRFTGISLIKSEQTRFMYQLVGHDPDWIDAGTERTATYSYLPPGKYTFQVKAANSDGVWNEAGEQLSIEFRPYFYQTTLFYVLCSLVFAAVLLFVWKASVRRLEARERRLELLVNERTADLAAANAILVNLANSDGLTRIGNRRRFESFLADEWHRAIRFKTPISLALFDIDHFKSFNDTYGHQAGDDCLQRVAEAFAETVKRPTDLVARFGGEEFALVLGGTDAAGSLLIVEKAVANVRELSIEHRGSATCGQLTVSVGLTTLFPQVDSDEGELINAADKALYRAKESGRDCIFVFDDIAMQSIRAGIEENSEPLLTA